MYMDKVADFKISRLFYGAHDPKDIAVFFSQTHVIVTKNSILLYLSKLMSLCLTV